MVTEHSEVDFEGQMQLPDDDEEDLCRVWDMAMDKVKFYIRLKDFLIYLLKHLMNARFHRIGIFVKVTTTQLKEKLNGSKQSFCY